MRNIRVVFMGCVLLSLAPFFSNSAHAEEIIVSAAASLTNAFQDIGKAFEKKHPGSTVRFNFASSGALLQQIRNGAPVDVFAAAAPQEMDALQKENRLLAGTRIAFASNRLVLIAPQRGRVKTWNDLAQPAVLRVAISNPESVPSGRYAQATLTRRKLWDAVRSKAVLGETVRQTLSYVTNGDADAGFVFATDARLERKRARVVAVAISGQDHPPITYPAAVVAGSKQPVLARSFVAFLRGKPAREILQRYGFTLSR
jgi:molybdate transport system substrate-binding protein